ncbi:serine/threonine-protein kinase [Novipirellula artificiosorum]|uniref:Serine/threonine-protein kinase PknB n=1 Tax=Novipirellula artificiosorum TaxID=2528016 RepID=A0A5C6CWP2_9BACT|nr:serine/threonine-protein kinase [Novipirellula artificiosorum]TWU27977.1 Serine/threonine-protein kinase PknB [Novipirellula artificiosorum]
MTLINDGGQIVSSSDATNTEVARPTIQGQAALTQIASAALSRTRAAQRSGFVLDPYVNHRGRRVVGAWSWVPGGSPTGVIIEQEVSSAYWFHFWLISPVLLGLCCLAAPPLVYLAKTRLKRKWRGGLPMLDGRYQLSELIGQGGYSQVFGATDLQLDRKVAVKVLSKRHSKGVSLGRFKREVRILASLTHPSTIRVFDTGVCENGSPFFVMELVDGLTLSQLVEYHGQQTEETTLLIIRQVCMALAEAHDAGLVHRDIKPQNIMVSHFGTAEQFIKVLDFGLGKSTVSIEDEHLSSSGEIAGTVQFMAPECVVSPEQVSPAADVYSLGAVMFYLLTGKPIFEGKNKLQLLSQVVEATWDSSRIPAALSLQAVESLHSALAKDPAIRPQNASEFADLLVR